MPKIPFKYTGVGSRDTPTNVCIVFGRIGAYLEACNGILRSGGANGADAAFESQLHNPTENAEIYLPHRKFNGHSSPLYTIDACAYEMARHYVKHWHNCNAFARRAHARNCYQVLGKMLNDSSKFLLCWTQDGLLNGGTATAISIALDHGIPVFNYGYDIVNTHNRFREFFKTEVP